VTLVGTGELVEAAVADGRAVAAFNVITLEHAEAIAAAAEATGTPLVLAISENAVRYHGGELEPIATATAAVARLCEVPLALHLDHVIDPALAEQSLGSVFSSVMIDAGALPYEENVATTADFARRAHEAGLWVEAELGYIGGKPGMPARSAHEKGVRTDPEEARTFVADTGVDALAVAVGSSHAMTHRTARLDHALIAQLHEAVPVPLVLHGSSGVPDDELRAAVRSGLTKINIGTALNIAMTAAVREGLDADPTLVDPRRYLAPARDAMQDTVERLLAVVRG